MSNTVSPTTNTHNTYSQEPAVKETVGKSKRPKRPSVARVQHDRNNPYTMINRSIVGDASISGLAKCVWLYAMTRPDDWIFTIEEISSHQTDGIYATRTAIKELINAGYLERQRVTNSKGQFVGYDYLFFEVKKVVLHASLPDTGKSEQKREKNSRCTGEPHKTGSLFNPLSGFPCTDNHMLLNSDRDLIVIEELSVTQPPVGAGVIADPPKAKILEPQEIGLIESHTVTDMVGAKTNIRFNDLFLLLMKEKFEFKTLELKEAWEILKGYRGPVSSIAKFMIGTIENLRKKQKSKDIKNAHSQGGTICMTQEEQPVDTQVLPSHEDYCSLTQEQIALIRSSHQAKLQKK
jgi:hypothetical protein